MTRREQIKLIIDQVARQAGLSRRDIINRDNRDHVCAARRRAIRAVAEQFPEMSSEQLGNIFHREHTTILHNLGRLARNRGRALMEAAE